MKLLKRRWICWVWAKVYRRWLWNDFYKEYDEVVQVRGWRTALIDTKGGARQTISPCFWWFR